MKLNVKKFAQLTGVSVRTLHYYDEIGLLKPDYIDEQNGYRFYDESAFYRMQEILFYRELDFSLKGIREILSSPKYNKCEALQAQKQLLILKKERLERIISEIERAGKGENNMDFKVFSNSAVETYKDEVKKRWGCTAAYKENEEKTAVYTEKDWNEVGEGMDTILSEFAEAMKSGVKVSDNKALLVVKKLKDFITETQYTCTDEILMCLGEMYVSDERFTENIDKHGSGTASYMNNAIRAYCEK